MPETEHVEGSSVAAVCPSEERHCFEDGSHDHEQGPTIVAPWSAAIAPRLKPTSPCSFTYLRRMEGGVHPDRLDPQALQQKFQTCHQRAWHVSPPPTSRLLTDPWLVDSSHCCMKLRLRSHGILLHGILKTNMEVPYKGSSLQRKFLTKEVPYKGSSLQTVVQQEVLDSISLY